IIVTNSPAGGRYVEERNNPRIWITRRGVIMPLFGRQHVRLPLINWNKVVQRPEARQAPTTRGIDCPQCGEPWRVAIRAINTRCTSCHQHLRLEDVVIRGDSPLTRVVTCGM